jgi:Tfp pilus assembly protein PilZ
MTGNTVILVSGMEPKESSAADAKQRRSARYNLGAAVELTDVESGRTKVGPVRALSLHGCFVKTEMLFRVGARVALKIAHSGSEFSAIGRVVVRVADQTNRGVGVEFTDLASIDRARLEAYLADLVREEKLANFAGLRKKLGMRKGKACEAGDSAKDEGTPKYPWQYAVIDAFKSPLDSLPGKINVAEKAIAARLTDANHADIEEQLALKDALQGLGVLLVGTRPRSKPDRRRTT